MNNHDLEENTKETKVDEITTNVSDETHGSNGILSLNDDALQTIFSFIGLGQYRWVGGTCKRFHEAYQIGEKETWCCPTKLDNKQIRLWLEDIEILENREQHSLQNSNVLTTAGSQPLAEYELVMKDEDTMLHTFLWAKRHWDNVDNYERDGHWYFHVANEAIDNARIDILEDLAWDTEVLLFCKTNSNLRVYLPREHAMGHVDWPVDPPHRSSEWPPWTGNQFFMKRAVEGGQKSWPSLMWLYDKGVRPMKGHAIMAFFDVAL
jgi:hypothetical protein